MTRPLVALIACTLVVVACADDKDPTTLPESLSTYTAPPESSNADAGNPDTAATLPPPDTGADTEAEDTDTDASPTTDTFPTTNFPTTDPDPESCALYDPPDACDDCTCNVCLDPFLACLADPTCKFMDDCFRITGCTEDACYDICGQEIADYGNDPYAGPYVDLSGCRNLECEADCGGFNPI